MKNPHRTSLWLLPALGFLALFWYLVRVVPKPSRAAYPCQRVAEPMALGFLAWLAGLLGLSFAWRKAAALRRSSRRGLALACLGLAACAGLLALVAQPAREAAAAAPLAHGALGVGQGIHPGRVVWAHDPDATDWAGFSSAQRWYDPAHTNLEVVERMLGDVVRGVAGERTNPAAWDALFRATNRKRGKGDLGYRPGEKIAIKINLTTCNARGQCVDPVTYDKKAVYVNRIDNSPQALLALLRQLVNQAGARQADITLGDTTGLVPNYLWDFLGKEFPNVRYWDNYGGSGRVRAEFSKTPIHWSTPAAAGKLQDCISDAIAEADYLVNFAILKGHSAGITLCAKNHYGSLIRCPDGLLRDQGLKNYYNLHLSCPDAIYTPGTGKYRAMVDLMGHPDLGGKTVLYLVDGLFAGYWWEAVPVPWKMPPFGDGVQADWPSSLFGSQDPVAIDSVGHDFLLAEWPTVVLNGDGASLQGGAEDYLHEAALAHAPPSGTPYDPDGDRQPLASLGVHEHWNDPVAKQYGRNLGAAEGIELFLAFLSGRLIDRTCAGLPAAQDPTLALAAGDVDGDGDLDLVVGNDGQADRLLLCDGAGRFAEAPPGSLPLDQDRTRHLVLGDLDLDGDLDLVACRDGLDVRFYLNDGAGRFAPSAAGPAAAASIAAFGDVDGDGDPDLVLGVRGGQNRLFLNDGLGRFSDATAGRLPAAADPTNCLLLLDLDRDGDLDLFAGNELHQNALYRNDGTGRFVDDTAASLPAAAWGTTCLAAGDVDGDGDPDLGLGTLPGEPGRLLLNDGTGRFSAAGPGALPAAVDETRALCLCDLDGDGDLDLLLGVFGGRILFWRNDGTGLFAEATLGRMPVLTIRTRALLTSDLDADGHPDLVAADHGGQNRLFRSDAPCVSGLACKIVAGGGTGRTSSLVVPLRLEASWSASPAAWMRLSCDGIRWGAWTPFLPDVAAWNLADGRTGGDPAPGWKSVFCQLRDLEGGCSRVAMARLRYLPGPALDAVAPAELENVTLETFKVSGRGFLGADRVRLGPTVLHAAEPLDWGRGFFRVLDDSTLEVSPSPGLAPGEHLLQAAGPKGASNSLRVRIVHPALPALRCPVRSGAGLVFSIFAHRGPLPGGTVSLLTLSLSERASQLPGFLTLAHGDGFGPTFLVAGGPVAHHAETGVASWAFSIPPFSGRFDIFVQAVLVDPARPWVVPVRTTDLGRARLE